jgi:NodT family efflux transporter outer membrane factor (OMF) lipoprotein
VSFLAFARKARGGAPALSLAAAMLLASCMVGPDFQAPKPTTNQNYTKDGPPVLKAGSDEPGQQLQPGAELRADWWALFHSPELDAMVRQAISDNKTLVQARSTLLQAYEQRAQAEGGLFPQANLGVNAERQRLDYAVLGIPANPLFPKFAEFDVYSVGPSVSYPLDIWGGTRRLIEERGAQAEYQGYQLAAAYLSLTGNAVAQAVTVAGIREQLKAVDDIIANDQENRSLVQREFDAGEVTQIDVESAQSQLESDRTLVPPLRQQLSAAKHALSLLVSKSPADWTPPDFDLGQMTLPPDLPVSLPSELVHQRPDILSAEAQFHVATAAVGVATAQLYPQITLSAAFEQVALNPQNVFLPMNNAWTLTAGLMQPVFHGGELEAQRRASLQALEAARAGYEQTVLQAFVQVANLLDALHEDGALIEAQHRAIDTAETSLKLTREAYTGGNIGILLVLDAQRRFQEARLGYVRATVQRYLDTVQLFAAMGGGWRDWQKTQPQPPAEDAGSILIKLLSP